MNPIVGIETVKYNEHLIEYNSNGDATMTSKTLFDVKFDDLKNSYIIRDDNSVYAFIKANENIFTILDAVQPILNNHFSDEKYYLEVRCYPEIYEKELALIIKVDYSKQDIEELQDRLMSVKIEANAHTIDLNLLGKFFITMEGT